MIKKYAYQILGLYINPIKRYIDRIKIPRFKGAIGKRTKVAKVFQMQDNDAGFKPEIFIDAKM